MKTKKDKNGPTFYEYGRAMDSLRFKNCSLQNFLSYLTETKLLLLDSTSAVFLLRSEIFARKNLYPYSYFDSHGKFNEINYQSINGVIDFRTTESVFRKLNQIMRSKYFQDFFFKFGRLL